MIDPDHEELLSLADAARCMPKVSGRRAHTSTLFRWCRRGLHGVRLEHVKVGRRIATSKEALTRFFNALAEAESEPPTFRQDAPTTRPRTAAARAHSIREAEDRLRDAGL